MQCVGPPVCGYAPTLSNIAPAMGGHPDRGCKLGKATCLGRENFQQTGQITAHQPSKATDIEDGNLNDKTPGPLSWGLNSSYKIKEYYRNQQTVGIHGTTGCTGSNMIFQRESPTREDLDRNRNIMDPKKDH